MAKLQLVLLKLLIRFCETPLVWRLSNALCINKTGPRKPEVVKAVAQAVTAYYEKHPVEAAMAAKQARVYQKVFFRQQIKSLRERIPAKGAATPREKRYLELVYHFRGLSRRLKEKRGQTETVEHLARYYADDIACELNPAFFVAFKMVSLRIFSNMAGAIRTFEEKPDTSKRIRELMGKAPVILIPNHVSNADHVPTCLAISWLRGRQPKIAAGANLFRGVSAEIMPRMNAYKIRREHIGDESRWPLNIKWFQNPIYRRVHTEYLNYIWSANEPFMFYIEGTRSRDGKIGKPKAGIVQNLFDFVTATGKTAYVVPVSISYSIVPEDEEIEASREGAKISKKDLIAQLMSLDKRYKALPGAAINLHFSEPLPLTPQTESLDDFVDKVMEKMKKGLVPTYTSMAARGALECAAKDHGKLSFELEKLQSYCEEHFLAAQELEPEDFAKRIETAAENFIERGFITLADEGGYEILNEAMLTQYANRLPF